MPILPFLVAVSFFLLINLFLALFLASLVVLILKIKGVQVETVEMNFLVFLCCASVWIGIRVILLNYYTFHDFTTIFTWPMSDLLPRDITAFLQASTRL